MLKCWPGVRWPLNGTEMSNSSSMAKMLRPGPGWWGVEKNCQQRSGSASVQRHGSDGSQHRCSAGMPITLCTVLCVMPRLSKDWPHLIFKARLANRSRVKPVPAHQVAAAPCGGAGPRSPDRARVARDEEPAPRLPRTSRRRRPPRRGPIGQVGSATPDLPPRNHPVARSGSRPGDRPAPPSAIAPRSTHCGRPAQVVRSVQPLPEPGVARIGRRRPCIGPSSDIVARSDPSAQEWIRSRHDRRRRQRITPRPAESPVRHSTASVGRKTSAPPRPRLGDEARADRTRGPIRTPGNASTGAGRRSWSLRADADGWARSGPGADPQTPGPITAKGADSPLPAPTLCTRVNSPRWR